MRINFIQQTKKNDEKNFWDVLRNKMNLKSSLMKMASKVSVEPREIVKDGMIIKYNRSGEYTIKLGHKSDIVVTGVAKQEKDFQQHVKTALSYLKSINPKVASELQKIEASKRDILVYKDIDRCRDCVFYESDTSHETYRDKCKNCVNATLGGTINNFFPRSQQIVMYAPQWEQIGDVEPKTAFNGTMSLLDAHRQGKSTERHPEAIADEILASVHDKDAVSLGTALFKYFETNKLNFQRYAKPVIESIEKQAGVQIHLRKDDKVILALDTLRLNPTEMTEEEKNKAGESIQKKMESGYNLTDEEKTFLDSWLMVFPKKAEASSILARSIIAGIMNGTDKYYGYSHFDSSNMADYTLMSTTISDMANVYGIGEEEAADIVQALTHSTKKASSKFLCPNCGSENIQRAKDYRLNQCLSCHQAFDNESARTESGEKQVEAKKKEKDIPGTLSKCDQEALDKYEEAKDKPVKSKEIMPKGKFEGTLCLAEAEDEKKKTYKIIKFFRDEGRKQQVMARGMSLDEAKSYCSRPETKKEGEWFCGYTEE